MKKLIASLLIFTMLTVTACNNTVSTDNTNETIAELQAQLDAVNKVNSSLEQELSTINKENNTLKNEISELEIKSQYEQKITELEKQIIELKNAQNLTTNSTSNIEDIKISGLETVSNEIIDVLKSLKTDISILETKVNDNQNTSKNQDAFTEIEDLIISLNESSETRENDIQNLKNEIEDYANTIKTLNTENSSLNSIIANLQTQLSELETENTDLQTKLQFLIMQNAFNNQTQQVPETPTTSEPETIKATSVSFDKSSISMTIGTDYTAKIIPNVLPKNTTEIGHWISSNTDIITVDSDGNIELIAKNLNGETHKSVTITYIIGDIATSAVIIVFENEKNEEYTEIPATSIILDKTVVYIDSNEKTSFTIKATVTPSNTTEIGTWTSSNPELIKIDNEGNAETVYESLNENTLETVILTYKVGNLKAAAVVVLKNKNTDSTTKPNDNPSNETDLTSLEFAQQSVSIDIEESITLELVKTPVDSDENITWSSADSTVATVDQTGKVTGVKAGSTVIYVNASKSGKQAACVVIVTANDIKISYTLTTNTENIYAKKHL